MMSSASVRTRSGERRAESSREIFVRSDMESEISMKRRRPVAKKLLLEWEVLKAMAPSLCLPKFPHFA
jgi:hypothetical protein